MNMLNQYYGITYTINILMGTSHTLSQYKIPNVANLQRLTSKTCCVQLNKIELNISNLYYRS